MKGQGNGGNILKIGACIIAVIAVFACRHFHVRADAAVVRMQAEALEDTVYVYESEDLTGRAVAVLAKGDIVAVGDAGVGADAVAIITPDNIEGYAARSRLAVMPAKAPASAGMDGYYDANTDGPATYASEQEYDKAMGVEPIKAFTGALASPSATGEKIAEYACRFVGNPYVWGGESLTDGADCSGFVRKVYEHFGYSLPRTSLEQRSAGELVCAGYDEGLAKPGDLICFDGHVALYIGNNRIVHAANRRDGIKISDADYRAAICTRRIIGSAAQPEDEDMQILCAIVEREAGGEDRLGKMLVADVVLNRVKSPLFPDTVKEVVLADGQFQPVKGGALPETEPSEDTIDAVRQALQEADRSGGALFFMNPEHSTEKNVRWFRTKLTFLCRHGNHEFYR